MAIGNRPYTYERLREKGLRAFVLAIGVISMKRRQLMVKTSV